MSDKKFSLGDSISFGWNTFKANIGFFLSVMVVFLIINVVFSFIGKRIDSAFLRFIINIISLAINTIMGIGLLRIALKFYDKQKSEIGDLFKPQDLFVKYLLVEVFGGLAVFIGFILLIVPGIILGIMFQFAGYFVVDKKLDAIEALKRSMAMTSGIKMDLFLMDVVLVVLNILGGICFGIGLLVTIPITILTIGYVYRNLLAKEEGIPQAPQEPTAPVAPATPETTGQAPATS
jgi:uncharacterized membrane protein